MKKLTAFALPLLLITGLSWPAAGAEDRGAQDTNALTFELSLDGVANWLVTLWFDYSPEASPELPADEQPKAFIEGVGPYIVPVGFTATNPAPVEQLATEDADPEDQ